MWNFVFPNGEPAVMTPAQTAALETMAARWNLPSVVEVSPMIGAPGALVVNVRTMFLVVETDGHTHS